VPCSRPELLIANAWAPNLTAFRPRWQLIRRGRGGRSPVRRSSRRRSSAGCFAAGYPIQAPLCSGVIFQGCTAATMSLGTTHGTRYACSRTTTMTSASSMTQYFRILRKMSVSLPRRPVAAQATAIDCGEISFAHDAAEQVSRCGQDRLDHDLRGCLLRNINQPCWSASKGLDSIVEFLATLACFGSNSRLVVLCGHEAGPQDTPAAAT